MENPTLDGPVSSPSAITPASAIYNMNDFTLNITPPAHDNTATVHIPQSSAAKQPKKRKSWGQALPEPKTTLPPRKRAKTDDEKEQRRIERIKRNRAAAHNSRERKRVEAERLEVENIELRKYLIGMQQALKHHKAQLAEFQRRLPNTLPPLSSDDFTSINFDFPTIKDESGADTPASTVDTIDPRASLSRSTPEIGTPFIKAESPSTSVAMPTPAASTTRASDDLTRHSAVMLYDLQCRSSRSLSLANRWWANFMLYLMHMNIMACYKALLAVTWTLWPRHMTRIMETPFHPTTPSSTASGTKKNTSRMIRPTRTTQRQQRIALSATSKTPSSLLTCLSLLLLSQTSAQSFLAKGLAQSEASAAKIALLSRLADEERKAVVSTESAEGVVSHLHGRSGRFSGHQENREHNDGGIG